jgi:hypothetical protein
MRVRIIGLSAAAAGRLAWLPIVAVLLAASCGGGGEGSDSGAGNGLTVFADSSLTEVFHELAPEVTFELPARTSLQRGSGTARRPACSRRPALGTRTSSVQRDC